MRNKLLTAVLLALALSAGCSFNAGITRGDEPRTVLFDRDNMRKAMGSTVRIRAYNSKGTILWMGSGNVYKKENNRLYILSNQHVCSNPKGRITCEFVVDGKRLGEYKARTDLCVQENGVDVAVVSLPQGDTLKDVPAVPIKLDEVKIGDEMFHCGCDNGRPQNSQLGEILDVSTNHFLFWPSAYAGDSGSAIVQFDQEGSPYIVGLVAWQTGYKGESVGMAMKSKVVLDVLKGGNIPELPEAGDVPPSSLESRKLIQGLLEKLRELREETQRERGLLLDRLSKIQTETELQKTEVQLFRDRFDRWKKDTEDNFGQIEDKTEGLQDRILGQFTVIKQMIEIAKWSFYALVAALLVSIFAGQGWLTRVIVTIFKVAFNCVKGSVAIIFDAINTPIKKTNSPSEALDNLREEIEDAFEDDSPD